MKRIVILFLSLLFIFNVISCKENNNSNNDIKNNEPDSNIENKEPDNNTENNEPDSNIENKEPDNNVENINLEDYKKTSKELIEQSLIYKEFNFKEDDWTKIVNCISNGKEQIDLASSKEEIDDIVYNVKAFLNNVYNDRIYTWIGIGEPFTEGDGTKDNPYIIDNVRKFIYFSDSINNKTEPDAYYELTTDLDLKNINWIPIGISDDRSFKGHFNGNGYEIKNCKISEYIIMCYVELDVVGLFGYNDGTIENLGIDDVNINVQFRYKELKDSAICAGGIVGVNNGIINNCYTIGNMMLNYMGGRSGCTSPYHIYSGGITAINKGVVSNSYANININIEFDENSGGVYVYGIGKGGKIENSFVILNYDIYDRLWSLDDVQVYDIGGYDEINCFRYQYDNRIFPDTCISDELNSKEFYVNKLNWNLEIWDLDNIVFDNDNYVDNCYPRLKKQK